MQYAPEPKVTPARTSDTVQFLLAKAAEVDDLLKDVSSDESILMGDADSSVDKLGEDDDMYIELDESVNDDDDVEIFESDEDSSYDEDGQFQAEFKAHKRNYYMEKLEYNEVDR